MFTGSSLAAEAQSKTRGGFDPASNFAPTITQDQVAQALVDLAHNHALGTSHRTWQLTLLAGQMSDHLVAIEKIARVTIQSQGADLWVWTGEEVQGAPTGALSRPPTWIIPAGVIATLPGWATPMSLFVQPQAAAANVTVEVASYGG